MVKREVELPLVRGDTNDALASGVPGPRRFRFVAPSGWIVTQGNKIFPALGQFLDRDRSTRGVDKGEGSQAGSP